MIKTKLKDYIHDSSYPFPYAKNGCMERVLKYFKMKVYDKKKTLLSLIKNLRLNGAKYEFIPYNPELEVDRGILITEAGGVLHASVLDYGVHHDNINALKLNKLYVIILTDDNLWYAC